MATNLSIDREMKKCISVRQPWASLLVAGIKKHESRSWKTNHRGILWVHSSSKAPNVETIRFVENYYKSHYKADNLILPETYPTGQLLGSIFVSDCLRQSGDEKLYRDSGANYDFAFICEQPKELLEGIPMKGQSRLYDAMYQRAITV